MEPMPNGVGSIIHYHYKGTTMKPSLMLAKKISQDELKEWSQRTWEEHFIEPKIDGERFVRTENGKWMSRQGKPKHNVEKICKAIDSVKSLKVTSLTVNCLVAIGLIRSAQHIHITIQVFG